MAEPSSSPSLPHEGDVVEGHFKILREKGVEYEVLDTQTGKVAAKHYSLSLKDRYTHSHLPEFQHYQVEDIVVKSDISGLSASVSLALLHEPRGEKVEGSGRSFKLEDKGKIRGIRDVLETGDPHVYCTVAKFYGVEFLEDIISLSKDPPILNVSKEISYLPSIAQPPSSLPRVGDVVEGLYKILRETRVEYEVLDIQTGKVSSKHYSLSNKDRYARSHRPEFQHYQVEDITAKSDSAGRISASVKLALLQGPQGDKVKGYTTRRFKVEEKGKIHAIRDGLERGDQDVYCTVAKFCGVEVQEDIRSLPKDPPILKLSEEMMSMICAHLEERDLYSVRLVSSAFAKTYLPLHKMWTISTLGFGFNTTNGMNMVLEYGTRRGIIRQRKWDHKPPLDFTDAAYVEFLRTTKTLWVIAGANDKHEKSKLLSVFRSCSSTKLESLSIHTNNNPGFDCSLTSQLIYANRSTLKSFVASHYNPILDIDLATISCCTALEKVEIRRGMVLNLESLISLKDSLTCLKFRGLKEPLGNDQLIWISVNLPNLVHMELDVLHYCYEETQDNEQVDEQAILSILEGGKLHKLTVRLGGAFDVVIDKTKPPWESAKRGRPKKYCCKANKIKGQVMRILNKNRKSSESKWKSDLSESALKCKHRIYTCHSYLSFALK